MIVVLIALLVIGDGATFAITDCNCDDNSEVSLRHNIISYSYIVIK